MASSGLDIPAGRALLLYNYEVTRSGYRRVDGYERFDGQPSPSAASYWIQYFENGSTEPHSLNIEINGATSGTTGVLVAYVVESGDWSTNDAAGYFVLTDLSGAFTEGENVRYSVSYIISTSTGSATQSGAATDALHITYKGLAQEARRGAINQVNGGGPVRGVWAYNDDVYAFRDNVAGTQCYMYKATTSGWSLVTHDEELYFDTGSAEIKVGDTVTGGTSGATGTVEAVILTNADGWAGSQEGKLVLSGVSGTFQAEAITSSPSSGAANSLADAIPQVLAPGGTFEFLNANFTGAADGEKMYVVNSVGRAFSFDGSTLIFIDTGLVDDKPTHVAQHGERLALSYSSSVMLSTVGDPHNYWGTPYEFAVGSEITALASLQGGVLAAFTLDAIELLYGQITADFEVKTMTRDVGAYRNTVRPVGDTMFLTPRGITTASATAAFGDFEHATISQLVDPFLDDMRSSVICASRSREKNQYRLFFDSTAQGQSNTTVLFARMEGNDLLGFSMGEYLFQVSCVANVDVNETERIFAGGGDGYVYELDAGTSFDGNAVQAFMRIPFLHFGGPTQRKRWMRAEVFMDLPESGTMQFQQEIDWADYSVASADATIQNVLMYGGGGVWDLNSWNEFSWSASLTGRMRAPLTGRGTSLGIVMYSEMTYELPYTIEAIAIHYRPGRLER